MIQELNERSRDIFRAIVETYLDTGSPVGSRTLSRRLSFDLSPASIRNVMADLEELGLLISPHTSAGRIPTDIGLRLFVDGLLEVGNLTSDERARIESQCVATGRSFDDVLGEATGLLSGLSHCAGLVVAPKRDTPLRHIEFVSLSPGRGLVIIATEDGQVENRLIDLPLGLPPSALQLASNYLNARLVGRTIEEARNDIMAELEAKQAELDALTSKVVATGLASWSAGGNQKDMGTLIVRGQSHLLEDVQAAEDIARIQKLLDDLENKRDFVHLLEQARAGQGVRVFIGSESQLYSMTGSSMVLAPYADSQQRIVGVIGVIGPTRLNYARVVPMVDYTARVIGKLLG